MKLSREQFIRRYLQHVAPKGFHLVRGYGVYRRGGNTEELRRRVREAVPITPELDRALGPRELPTPQPSDDGMTRCSICGSPLSLIQRRARASPLRVAA
jgi:hypothetical protein